MLSAPRKELNEERGGHFRYEEEGLAAGSMLCRQQGQNMLRCSTGSVVQGPLKRAAQCKEGKGGA